MYSEKARIFGFKQLTTAMIAFVTTISKKLHEMMPDLPVFVLVTGDNNYIMDEKFQTVSNELYEKTPRFVITLNSLERDQGTDTAVFNRYEFLSQDEENPDNKDEMSRAVIRRLCYYLNCNCTMVSPNFISAMTHFEMMCAIFSRENPYTYEYQGSTFNGAFTSDSHDFEFPELDSGSRNFNQKLDVKVQIHLYTPRLETVVNIKDYQYDGVGVEIQETGVINRKDSVKEVKDKNGDEHIETETDYMEKDLEPEEIAVEGVDEEGNPVEPRRDDDIPYTSTNRETNV